MSSGGRESLRIKYPKICENFEPKRSCKIGKCDISENDFKYIIAINSSEKFHSEKKANWYF